VVSRAYGGVHLGKARFEHIRERVRTVLVALKARPDRVVTHDWGGGARRLGGGGGLFRVQAAPPLSTKAPQFQGSEAEASGLTREGCRELLAEAAERRLSGCAVPGPARVDIALGASMDSALEPRAEAVVELSSSSG